MTNGDVRHLFLRALDVAPEARAAFLDDSEAPPEVRAAVLTLLRYDSGSETFLRQAVSEERPLVPDGERFGPYQLGPLLGRGGMGAVFRAERVDGELHQTVAIKIAERDWIDPRAFERFRVERQILASLVHPNIARLLDGGTRDDGLPYLVMEFVDGLRLDQYCEQHGLPLDARLRIFLPLCDAVDYAHRKLIVHRDLKPANVLVTAEGVPKLLDFGIARVLDTGFDARTQTVILTPDFASPEQVRGEEVTTSADVYGLGAVLYHLLTGRAPHAVEGLSPYELQRAICDTPPTPPGDIRPDLRGDVQNILLKALDPEPTARYGSARELGADIERYLDHRPVIASPHGPWYRLRRFVRRHTLATAVAAIAALALATSTGVSLYEARRARQGFAQVRELANHFIFDFEKSIRFIPGTLAARRMVADTARQYLASLAADARGDPSLTSELAESLRSLSRVELSAARSEAALKDLEQAVTLLRGVRADCCFTPAARLLFIGTLGDLARNNLDSHSAAVGLPLSQEAVANARLWLTQSPATPEVPRALAEALCNYGYGLLVKGDFTEARRVLTESTQWAARAVQASPNDEDLLSVQASTLKFLSALCFAVRDGPCARDSGAQAEDIMGALLVRHPENTAYRNKRTQVALNRTGGLGYLAEQDPAVRPQAVEAARGVYEMAKANVLLNPQGSEESDILVVATERLGRQLDNSGRKAEAEFYIREEGADIEALIRRDPQNRRYLQMQFINHAILGEMLINHGGWDPAATALTKAEHEISEVLAREPSDTIALQAKVWVLANRASLFQRAGDLPQARRRCQDALEVAAGLIHLDPAMEKSMGVMDGTRRLARQLGVPDPTRPTSKP
jgi:serine/threonine protein kinase